MAVLWELPTPNYPTVKGFCPRRAAFPPTLLSPRCEMEHQIALIRLLHKLLQNPMYAIPVGFIRFRLLVSSYHDSQN